MTAVGDVLSALAGSQAHIPYRNSKLTTFLRGALHRDSVALVMVPAPAGTHVTATDG